MPVKPSQSASRVLALLEKIAELQPVGISALARALDEDMSAVQRALKTLAHDGWIQAAAGKPTRWEVTARIHAVAHSAHGSHDLRHRARPLLQALRDETEESATLNMMDRDRFVVMDRAESRHPLRVVLEVGATVQATHSATGRAILPYMPRERWAVLLGGEPDALDLEAFSATLARGYSISSGIVVEGFTNIAAPIFEADGRPVAAILVSGPVERVRSSDHERIGALVRAAAKKLSRGVPADLAAAEITPSRRGHRSGDPVAGTASRR
jgi:IclR family acetate operon transcriptional repressor